MKTKKLALTLFSGIALSCAVQPVHAQFFKKLKDKVNSTVDQKVDDILSGKKTSSGSNGAAQAASVSDNDKKFFEKAALAYNFTPGKTLILEDNFSTDATGNMARLWKTSGSGSVEKFETLDGQWLSLNQYTTYKLKSDKALPANFTIEFDIATHSNTDTDDLGNISFGFAHDNNATKFISDAYNDNGIMSTEIRYSGKSINNASSETKINNTLDFPLSGYAIGKMHVAILVKGETAQVYLDKVKVLDTPMFLKSTGNNFFYISAPFKLDHDARIGFSNFKLAAL